MLKLFCNIENDGKSMPRMLESSDFYVVYLMQFVVIISLVRILYLFRYFFFVLFFFSCDLIALLDFVCVYFQFLVCLFLCVCRKSIESTNLGRASSVEQQTKIRSVPKTAFRKKVAGKLCGTDEEAETIDEDGGIAVGYIKSTTTSLQTPSRQASSSFTS